MILGPVYLLRDVVNEAAEALRAKCVVSRSRRGITSLRGVDMRFITRPSQTIATTSLRASIRFTTIAAFLEEGSSLGIGRSVVDAGKFAASEGVVERDRRSTAALESTSGLGENSNLKVHHRERVTRSMRYSKGICEEGVAQSEENSVW